MTPLSIATGWTGMSRAIERLRAAVPAALGVGLFVLVWESLSRQFDPVQLPPPADVWQALKQGWDDIPALDYVGFQTGGIKEALLYTTKNVLVGASIGTLAGIVVGAVVGAFRTAAAVLGPPLIVLGATPVLVILPFILIWFGTNAIAQSSLVIMFTFMTVAAVTQMAVSNIGPHYVQFGSCLGASKGYLFRHVIMPATGPAVLGGVRVSLALGWSFATVSELIGGQHGAGKLIQAMAQLQRTDVVIAAVIALSLVALVIDALVSGAGHWLTRWQEN
ncbi:ABC transporter permease [Nonomuraea basaltis]|nr:ABC transporter permease [Nonomuraea basaltis]